MIKYCNLPKSKQKPIKHCLHARLKLLNNLYVVVNSTLTDYGFL